MDYHAVIKEWDRYIHTKVEHFPRDITKGKKASAKIYRVILLGSKNKNKRRGVKERETDKDMWLHMYRKFQKNIRKY